MDHGAHEQQCRPPRAKSLNPLRTLLPFIRPYRGMMVAAWEPC